MTGTAVPQGRLRQIVLTSLLLLFSALLLGLLAPAYWPLWLTSRMVMQQDVWLLLTAILAWALAAGASARAALQPGPFMVRPNVVLALAVTLAVLCYAGHYLVLNGYDLTRDEQMVTFDAWIFGHGHLAWPIPREWQGEASALNLMFMLPVDQPVAWVSAYLPGNAALHALVGKAIDPAWTAPLLTGFSLLLLASIARRLWPDDRETAAVPVILFVLSGQILLSGMTTYAMAAHLCFNLAWLRLFLVDRRSTDLLMLGIGFVATGLHQPLFHPLFVAPFVMLVLIERRWDRATLFTLGYAAIGLFWLSWPEQMFDRVSGPLSRTAPGGVDYPARLREVFSIDWLNLTLMGANLTRLFTWQHAALLPLLLAAWPAVRRGGLAFALALGLALPVLVLALILPWQGNGFGYRYVHPVLGNAFLLAGFGWQELQPLHERLRPALAVTSACTALMLLPMWLVMSHARYAPYAQASRTIDASGADYAVLQMSNGLSYGSVVFNRPDLTNRPIRLDAEAIRDPAGLARRICHPGASVAMADDSFFRPGTAYFATVWPDKARARLPALRAPYEAAGCRIVMLR